MDELPSTENLLDGSLTNQNLAFVPNDKYDNIARRSKGTFVNFDDDNDDVDDGDQSNSINGYVDQGYTYDNQTFTKEHAAVGQEAKSIKNCTEYHSLEITDLAGAWDCEVSDWFIYSNHTLSAKMVQPSGGESLMLVPIITYII